MNFSADIIVEIRKLAEAAISGDLDDAQSSRLDDLLLTDPRARREYVEYVTMIGGVRQKLAGRAPVSQSEPPNNRFVPAGKWPKVAAAVAALLLMFLLARSWEHLVEPADDAARSRTSRQPAQPGLAVTEKSASDDSTDRAQSPHAEPLAQVVIVEAAHARIYGQGFSVRPGELLAFQKEYVLTQGVLALEFASGARAVLNAPGVFLAVDPGTLCVRSGHCSVHAPPGAEGFCVQTPTARIVDLGTRFVVEVASTGETDMQVIDGAATVATTSADESLLLQEGDAAHFAPGAAPQRQAVSPKSVQYVERLPDRVIRYDATVASNGYADELLSVTVQRGGRVIEYFRDDLVRCRLTHFVGKVGDAFFCTPQDQSLPEGVARLDLLDNDWSLVTGVINPRMPAEDASPDLTDPVMAVEFAAPIVNGPGPDILLFDLQLLTYPEHGDVLRLRRGEGSHERPIHQIDRFDIDLSSPNALDLHPFKYYFSKTGARSVDDLANLEFATRRQSQVHSKALVAGIDLTDLGCAPGATLRRLEFLQTGTRPVDPVLIVGLPEVAER